MKWHFSGAVATNVFLNTAELDFDIKVGEWLTGSLILGFDPGQNPLFPTSQTGGTGTAGIAVDRITVDRASVTIGDPFRFPFFVRAGRDVIPFGTSTGFSRTSGLSIESPAVDPRSARIGVEHRLAVGGPRETVRDMQPINFSLDLAGRLDAVEHADRLFRRTVVHAADPETSLPVDMAVIHPKLRRVREQRQSHLELSARGVESPNARRNGYDEAAVLSQADR